MRPLITIGIASYNYEKYIEKALLAIRKQNFTDYEVLISDDASTDSSVSLIQKFIDNNPQMQIRLIVNTENRGLVANKNTLIENCRGKYIMLCDADDWMADNCLEKIAEVIYKEKPDRIIAAVSNIDEEGRIIQVQQIPEHQTKWGWNIHHASVCRVDLIRQHNIKIEDEPDDVYFTMEFAKYCEKVVSINEPLYFWRVHLDSEGRKKKGRNFSDEIPKYIRELDFVGETIKFLKSDKKYTRRDVEECRMVLLKLYYFNLFFVTQIYSLDEKLYCYQVLHKEITSIDPHYLQNDFLKLNAVPILRSYASKSTKLFALLEKVKLIKLALVCFHIVSKVKYFDQ